MFRSIWQLLRGVYTRQRSGIDKGNIEHLRADLRFRLAMVEYAYFGRSGKRVARCLAELKSILGDKAVHRYLRTLDPDLRTQFVERFQAVRRNAGLETEAPPEQSSHGVPRRAGRAAPQFDASPAASNVVPFDYAARKTGGSAEAEAPDDTSQSKPDTQSIDSSD